VGNVDAAGALFTRAVNLEPRLELEPSIEARRLAAPFLVAQGTRLAHMGHVSEALKAYELANAYDHHLEIDAQSWFEVCRAGILGGAAKEVLDACERAVKAADQSGKFRDYLGVARALTGDTGGAIQDLEAYVTFEQRHHAGHPGSVQERRQLDYIAKVQGWIDALKLGKDPFTKVELKALP
jgi:tetratricopeptide (TPR) repeat protein